MITGICVKETKMEKLKKTKEEIKKSNEIRWHGLTPEVNPAGEDARAPVAFPKGEGDF